MMSITKIIIENGNEVKVDKAKNTGFVDLEYLISSAKTYSEKKLYEKMKGKDIYEIVYTDKDDCFGSAGSYWFETKEERDKEFELIN